MKSKVYCRRKGFSLAELLVALAVSCVLMAAIAVAFNASAVNYRENEDLFAMVNMTRQVLNRITHDIRTATAVSVSEPSNQCSMITSQGSDITYFYNAADEKLYLVTNDNLADADYVLCENVSAMSFSKETALDENSVEYVRRVQISITVTSGSNQRTVSSAALVRRNL